MQRKDGADNDRLPQDWRGKPRSNTKHQSRTDDDSLPYRKRSAAPAQPSDLGHVLSDDQQALVVNVRASLSEGMAKHEVAAQMLADVAGKVQSEIVAADKAYDSKSFVKTCCELSVTPHVAQNINRLGGSAIVGRTTQHQGDAMSTQFAGQFSVGASNESRLHGASRCKHLTP